MNAAVTAAGWLADVQQKTPPDDKVTPGLLGFLVTFGLVIAVILLIRSMVVHVRRVQYSPDPAARDAVAQKAQQERARPAVPQQSSAQPDDAPGGENQPGQ